MKTNSILKISLLLPFILVATSLFYSATASCKHKKHHHSLHHIRHAVHHTAHHASSNLNKTDVKEANDHELDVSPRVWGLALKAYNKALAKGYIKQKIVTIIDYSLPSSVKRMWVVHVPTGKVLYHTLVAHGKHTGALFAKHFSDQPGSLSSSLGLFVTENTYFGSNGYSLRLRGLEPGFNNRAKSRAIVMHGAWYATADFAAKHGRLGLSWGCPAVSPQLAKPIINDIKEGTLVFAYYPDDRWLQSSQFLL